MYLSLLHFDDTKTEKCVQSHSVQQEQIVLPGHSASGTITTIVRKVNSASAVNKAVQHYNQIKHKLMLTFGKFHLAALVEEFLRIFVF